ncbi:MAG: alpha-N-arabinofuranosidase [Oscillospiraceae bacterium]|jgi:alpha-N-arabinofuranosidase|nr:alpha-N-arabinofuranosidase [Oscillospiraceae bacterium]
MYKLVINANEKKSVINRNIYGHFSEHLGRCIYGGLFVGEQSDIPNVKGMRTDVVNALKNIKAPVLRWPGGCFADEYHWKDGVGPLEGRKRMINTHWGGVVEDNSFGTHEFMELCAQIGCEPYVNGNVGSGTVQEMSEWVEYITFDGVSPMAEWRGKNGRTAPWKLKYFCVGNENWGCGGNMRPEYYADEYRRYQTYLRNYGDNKLYKIACGPNGANYEWTDKFMEIAGKYADAISLHYYTVPGEWKSKGSATDFTTEKYYQTLHKAFKMEELISNHLQIMNRHDPAHTVDLIVDEWGTWYDVEPGTNPGFLYQQNTMRDAMVAALTLDIFNAHSDRVSMANIAQTVNVLQSVILTDGAKMLLTPTYHVFDLYKNHHDATLLGSWLETGEIGEGDFNIPNLSATASEKDGKISLTITNLSATDTADMECALVGAAAGAVSGRLLAGKTDDKNDFDTPDTVCIKPFNNITSTADGIRFTLPACSVAEITLG